MIVTFMKVLDILLDNLMPRELPAVLDESILTEPITIHLLGTLNWVCVQLLKFPFTIVDCAFKRAKAKPRTSKITVKILFMVYRQN